MAKKKPHPPKPNDESKEPGMKTPAWMKEDKKEKHTAKKPKKK